MIDLKPCPFCPDGGKPMTHSWRDAVKEVQEVPMYIDDYGYPRHTKTVVLAKGIIAEAFCESCGATIRECGEIPEGRKAVRQRAVDKWNRRANDA